MALDDLADAGPLLRPGEAQPRADAGRDGVVAGGAAEDEVDRREHLLLGQQLDHVDPAGGGIATAGSATAPAPPRVAGVGVEAAAVRVGPAVDEGGQHRHLPGLGVLHQVPVVEGDGPFVLDDHRRGAAHRADPVGQLGRVGDRGRQAHEAHRRRKVDDDLLPHRAAVGVLEVVDLVEHDPLEALQGRGAAVDHVAEHLGGHHHHLGVAVDRRVARQQPDPVGAVEAHEVVVLLVRERLDGGRVEGPATRGERHRHRMLGHHRLARAGGGADEDRPAGVDGLDGLELESVEGEAPVGGVGHCAQARAGPAGHPPFGTPLARCGVSCRRRRCRRRRPRRRRPCAACADGA